MDGFALLKAGQALLEGAVGGTVAILGLSRWLGDVWLGRLLEKEKAKYAREIEELKAGFGQELERYRAQLDRSIFVTRAHFETEFMAMKEVSQCLSEVKIAFLSLHPIDASLKMTDPERAEGIEWLQRANDMKVLRKLVPKLDSIIEQCILEGLSSFERQTYFAAAVMVGAAAEKAVYLLAESMLDAVTDVKRQETLKKLMERRSLMTCSTP